MHRPFQYLLTVETAARRDGGEIRTVAGTGGLRVEEADDGAPEMVAADTIPNARNADVRETLEGRMPSSFDACESVVLELHVDWPNQDTDSVSDSSDSDYRDRFRDHVM